MKYLISNILLFSIFTVSVSSQTETVDFATIDYEKIYSYCLDANIKSALELISVGESKISEEDKTFINRFEKRFSFSEDISGFVNEHSSEINPLLSIFHKYWREALLSPDILIDAIFLNKVSRFFFERYSLSILQMDEQTLDSYFIKYIEENGLYATAGIGKTGKLYDLLVWENQKDSVFTFDLHDEKLTVKVVLMNDFVTLGWEEYATLGRYYPGGWATSEALYCVEKAYDMNSENFLVSYLAHEGRHFSDYKLFPELSNTELEYRAKLTELSLAETSLWVLIQNFINNSNANSDGGHSKANYLVVSNLSKRIFENDFENDIDKWKSKNYEVINDTAYLTLKDDTEKRLNVKLPIINKSK